jgi:hypothetical protein
MKSLDFQAWLLGWDGYRLRLLANLTEFSVTRNIKDGGGIQVTLDAATASSIPALSLLTVERGWDGAAPSYMDTFVLSNRTRSQAARGTRFVTLQGADIGSWLLGKRGRVAFTHLWVPTFLKDDSTNAMPVLNYAADDGVKRAVDRALLSGSGSTAHLKNMTSRLRLSVAGNKGQGPMVVVSPDKQTLSSILDGLRGGSESNANTTGRRLYWWWRATDLNPLTLVLETQMDRRGRDLRESTCANPVVLSVENGSLSTVSVQEDMESETNALAVSYTSSSISYLVMNERATYSQRTPISYAEATYGASATTQATALAESQATLSDGLGRRFSRAGLAFASQSVVYGRDLNFGDLCTVDYGGIRWDVVVAGEESRWTPQGVDVTVKLDEYASL